MTAARYAPAMLAALDQAQAAREAGEIPIGAVVLDDTGQVIAAAHNARESRHDPTAHAEVLALREAAATRESWRLDGCTLVVTLEPCPMCAAAAGLFRIRRVVFGAYDPKGGGVEHGPRIYAAPGAQHRPEVVGGVRESEAAALLKAFFAKLR